MKRDINDMQRVVVEISFCDEKVSFCDEKYQQYLPVFSKKT